MARKKIVHGEEIRTTNSSTGAQKGAKLAQHSLIPPEVLHQLAELFGRGAQKYAKWNWRRGYDWSLSYDALQRHLNLFWSGIDFDEETGAKHIVNAMWHCCVLATFMDEHPDKDDRFSELVYNVPSSVEKRNPPSDPDDYMRRP